MWRYLCGLVVLGVLWTFTGPVAHAQDYLAPYYCQPDDPDAEVVSLMKWLGVNSARYEIICPIADMGYNAKDMGGCQTLAQTFVKDGILLRLPLRLTTDDGPPPTVPQGIVVQKLHNAYCIWVCNGQALRQSGLTGVVITETGFFFRSMP